MKLGRWAGGERGWEKTHNLDDGLAIVLDGHGERGLEAGGLVGQDDKGLVGALGLAILGGRQEDLDGVRIADGSWLADGGGLRELLLEGSDVNDRYPRMNIDKVSINNIGQDIECG